MDEVIVCPFLRAQERTKEGHPETSQLFGFPRTAHNTMVAFTRSYSCFYICLGSLLTGDHEPFSWIPPPLDLLNRVIHNRNKLRMQRLL